MTTLREAAAEFAAMTLTEQAKVLSAMHREPVNREDCDRCRGFVRPCLVHRSSTLTPERAA